MKQNIYSLYVKIVYTCQSTHQGTSISDFGCQKTRERHLWGMKSASCFKGVKT